MKLANKTAVVIGAGPAGLMAAEVLSLANVKVSIYDAMPSVGRKFLMAGKGGLNITHAEPFDQFLSRYGKHSTDLEAMLQAFNPEALRLWVEELGINTFVGSSGRVFPAEMKAAPLLRAWVHRLRTDGVSFRMRSRWLGWAEDGNLRFAINETEENISADVVILALGGGSWPQLGSNGAWLPILAQCGIDVSPLLPANCGFETSWSEYFRSRFAGQPLKSVGIAFHPAEKYYRQGDLIVTEHGLEGGAIYALSAMLRDEINNAGSAQIHLDLSPDRDLQALLLRLSVPRGKDSLANHLRKRLGMTALKTALIREVLSNVELQDMHILAATIKALPLKLLATRLLPEAISSAGGVCFSALDQHLMLKNMPGVFCAGEMLDWEAPTGGYLLTACFATGLCAGLGGLNWLKQC